MFTPKILKVMDFVQRVRDSRTAQARRQALKRVTYASVVQEEAVPQLGISFGGGGLFPKPKRSLRPEVCMLVNYEDDEAPSGPDGAGGANGDGGEGRSSVHLVGGRVVEGEH